MVKRRKFLIGTGSLLAGAAATIGTGALSSTTIDRDATGVVTGDASAYITLTTDGAGVENGEYAVVQENGQLALDFGFTDAPGSSQSSEGLNQDSVNNFDDVFRISVQDNGGGAFNVYIQSNEPRLEFYKGGDPTDTIDASNKQTLEAAQGENTNLNVGVRIDLENYDQQTEDLFGGDNDFTIVAEDAD